MSFIKIFSGSEIMAQALQIKLQNAGINTIAKNNIQSGRFSGFGTADQAVELFIKKIDFVKANLIIEEFRLSIL